MKVQNGQPSVEEWAQEVEELLVKDNGPHKIQGGVRSLYERSGRGHLLATARKLLTPEVKAVAILVGSPNASIMWPPTDTDGPGGAFALTQALQKLGRKVVIVTDKIHHGQVLPALKSAGLRLFELPETKDDLSLEDLPADIAACATFPNKNCWRTDLDDTRLQRVYEAVDVVLNVGRLGPGKDGCYRAHDRANVTIFESYFERFFVVPEEWSSKTNHHVSTVVIGELGNEMGMGPAKEAVEETVEFGKEIVCSISADLTIIASTVNWGAWALCTMLALLSVDGGYNQNVTDLLAGVDTQQEVLRVLVEEGARCGVTWAREEIIDNVEASRHWDFINTLRQFFSRCVQAGLSSTNDSKLTLEMPENCFCVEDTRAAKVLCTRARDRQRTCGRAAGGTASAISEEKARTVTSNDALQDSSESASTKNGDGRGVAHGQASEIQANPPAVTGSRAAS